MEKCNWQLNLIFKIHFRSTEHLGVCFQGTSAWGQGTDRGTGDRHGDRGQTGGQGTDRETGRVQQGGMKLGVACAMMRRNQPWRLLSELPSVHHLVGFPLLPPESSKGRGPYTPSSRDKQDPASAWPSEQAACLSTDQECSLCVISATPDLSIITEVITRINSHPDI